MQNRRGALFFWRYSIKFQDHTGQKQLLILTRIEGFRTVIQASIHRWLWNDAQSLMYYIKGALLFLAATKQLYEWLSSSVRTSVRPSHLFHYLPIIASSRVITNDRSDVHAKNKGERSKINVTEVKTQLNSFRTVTPIWIHIWWWKDAQLLMLLRRGALLFFKVRRQISRSHGTKNHRFWLELSVPGL